MKNKRYFIHLALLNAKGGILVNRGGLCECGLRSHVLGSLFRTLLVVVCHCNVRDFNSQSSFPTRPRRTRAETCGDADERSTAWGSKAQSASTKGGYPS